MREIKYRGKIEGRWDYATFNPDGDMGEWAQFWALVDGKTVGQYIGLTDKSAKEIYEGDVCRLSGDLYEVYWHEDRWGLKGTPDSAGFRNDYDSGDYYRGDDINNWQEFETIGNIYEHPHLMKEPLQ